MGIAGKGGERGSGATAEWHNQKAGQTYDKMKITNKEI